ncbi:MAG: hypothetical protein KDC92_13955 [Bacteroidetes bacterium]|nr:hypothetical protein [Bacteroidota bacterium]
MLVYAIRIILWAGIIATGYWIYSIIYEDIKIKENKVRIEEKRRQRMYQIRDVLAIYKSQKNQYTDNWDELVRFAKHDSLQLYKITGDPKDTLNPADTVVTMISVADSLFKENKSVIDSLPFVPEPVGVGKKKPKFELVAKSIDYREQKIAVFEVTDPNPLDDDEPLKMGSLEKPNSTINR